MLLSSGLRGCYVSHAHAKYCSRRLSSCRIARRHQRCVQYVLSAKAASSGCASYVDKIEQCELNNNWQDLIEVLAEARVLNIELPASSYEAAIRTLCEGGQAERAAKILRQVRKETVALTGDVIVLVFSALSRARAAQVALDLFPLFDDESQPYFGEVYNAVTRACARGGLLDEALAMLDKIVVSDGAILRQTATFDVVASECINNGRPQDGLDVLELRDYL